MSRKLLYSIFFLMVFALMHRFTESKQVVIHVPYRVKNVKHTHTIYKIIPHHRKGKHEDEENYDLYQKR